LRITFDPAKSERNKRLRGLSFERAEELFAGVTVSYDDARHEYGEVRTVTVGMLDGRLSMVVWTPRGAARRIISLRHCNEQERKRFQAYIDAT
jgi:hypothetical protein